MVLYEPNMMVSRIFLIISMLRISTTSTFSAYLRAALTENFAKDVVLNRGQCHFEVTWYRHADTDLFLP